MATTARREAVRVSKLGSRQVVADPWSFLEQPEANTEEAGARLMDKERDMTVQYALAVMPERCRALLLATTEDPPVPYETLAEHLGLAPGSIGPTRRRCLDQMRDLIEALAPELVEGAERPSVRL